MEGEEGEEGHDCIGVTVARRGDWEDIGRTNKGGAAQKEKTRRKTRRKEKEAGG